MRVFGNEACFFFYIVLCDVFVYCPWFYKKKNTSIGQDEKNIIQLKISQSQYTPYNAHVRHGAVNIPHDAYVCHEAVNIPHDAHICHEAVNILILNIRFCDILNRKRQILFLSVTLMSHYIEF